MRLIFSSTGISFIGSVNAHSDDGRTRNGAACKESNATAPATKSAIPAIRNLINSRPFGKRLIGTDVSLFLRQRSELLFPIQSRCFHLLLFPQESESTSWDSYHCRCR